MASYAEIEKENNPKTTIIKYAGELHEKTGRNVIIYYSGWLTIDDEKNYINPLDKIGMMNMIKDLDNSKWLDLILHSPGGNVDTTESIIDYLHSVFGEDIRAIIPHMAMSGATMIACTSKEIIMGKHSSLGPVDPQIGDISAQNVIKEYELAKKEIEENPDSIPFWEILLNKYPANFQFECENTIDWSNDILKKTLKNSMFKENNEELIDKITCELTSIDVTKTHSRNLSAEKCMEIGLNIKYLEEDAELEDMILSIHHACTSFIRHENVCKIYLNHEGEFISINSEND